MDPLQAAGDPTVPLLSLLALVVYALAGGAVALDAKSRGVDHYASWGGAVFLALLAGTIVFDRQLLGAIASGGFVIALYVATERR